MGRGINRFGKFNVSTEGILLVKNNKTIQLILLIVALTLGAVSCLYAEPKIMEYTDNEYKYTFQFPADWKMQKVPPTNEMGEVRVLLQSPHHKSSVMVLVGHIEKGVNKTKFNNSPKRNEIVERLIDLTIEKVYKKTSKDMKATRMVVTERKIDNSEIGIKFYISTLHYVEKEIPMVVAGMHAFPFGKNYIIGFIMTNILDPKDDKEKKTFTSIFNSFHLVGEKPVEGR